MQVIPELSDACDTADQELDQLHVLAIAERTAVNWLHLFLSIIPQEPLTGSCSSSPRALTWRMPQGSILPPLLVSIYAKPPGNMKKLISSNASHYLDDRQLHVSFPPRHADSPLPNLPVLKAMVLMWTIIKCVTNHQKGLPLSFSSQHNSLFKQWPGCAHLWFLHLGWPSLTLYLRLHKQQRQRWLENCGTYTIAKQAKEMNSPQSAISATPLAFTTTVGYIQITLTAASPFFTQISRYSQTFLKETSITRFLHHLWTADPGA